MISQQQVRGLFNYDPLTGDITYKIDQRPRGKAGNIAGWINKAGYRKISIEGKEYQAHHIIWLWMTGILPSVDIDHKNHNRSDNVWTNLRLATRSQNLNNQTGLKHNNKSGYKGVCSRGNSHGVSLRVNKKIIRIGSFSSAEEAARAYDKAAIKHQGQFAVTNKSLGLI